MFRHIARHRPALLAFVIVLPSGAASPGCRDKRARNAHAPNAQASSNMRHNTNAAGAVSGREFRIRYGQEVSVEGDGLKVRFSEVVADSRCPVGVTCVWEGDAEVRLDVSGAGDGAAQVALHTSDRFGRESRHAGRVFKLVALAPRPRADAKTNANDYVLTLAVGRE